MKRTAPWIVACLVAPLALATAAENPQSRRLAITVRDVTGLSSVRPVTGELTLAVSRSGILDLAGRYDVRFTLVDERGRECPGVVESSSLDPAGPLRSTLALSGAFRTPAGDERIPEAVRRGVTHINRETWEANHSGWRYTSCPRSGSGPGRQTGVVVMSLVNSVVMTGDADHLRILRQAWDAKFERLKAAPVSRPGLGKTYSTTMYGSPEAMHLFVDGRSE